MVACHSSVDFACHTVPDLCWVPWANSGSLVDQMNFLVHSICVMRFRSSFELSSPATGLVGVLTLVLPIMARWKTRAPPKAAKKSGGGPWYTSPIAVGLAGKSAGRRLFGEGSNYVSGGGMRLQREVRNTDNCISK